MKLTSNTDEHPSDLSVHVESTRGGGVRVYVSHEGSDSLAIFHAYHGNPITRNGEPTLMAKVGTRGNYDALQRPITWGYSHVIAPMLTEIERAKRKERYMKRARRAGWIK